MGKLAIFGILLVLAFSLVIVGCTANKKMPDTGKQIANLTDTPDENVPQIVETRQPSAEDTSTTDDAIRAAWRANRTREMPPIPHDSAIAKQEADPLIFNDNAYGFSFTKADGMDVFAAETGCRYWGGATNCIAIFLDNRTKEKIAEYRAEPYNGRPKFDEYLTNAGRMARISGGYWYDVWYTNQKGLKMEFENSTYYTAGVYLPVAGSAVSFEVNGNGTWKERAKQMFSTLRIGGEKSFRTDMHSFPCFRDTDCMGREFCLDTTFCTAINASDENLKKLFNSSDVCISDGGATCRLRCEKDSDCPSPQHCTIVKSRRGSVYDEKWICD